jgi:plastocyanin
MALRRFIVLVAIALLWCFSSHSQCVVEGTVALPAASAEKATPARYEGQAASVGTPEPPTAIVFLEGPFPASTNRTVQLSQQHLQFSYALLPVQKGTTVEFPNMDDGYHNVFSYSKPKRFDLGRYRKDEKPASQTFDQPGVIKLYCEIHDHMRSTILVLETPYFTKTSTNGTYSLTNLPPGNFMLKAWIDEKTVLQKPVTLSEGQPVHIDFKRP